MKNNFELRLIQADFWRVDEIKKWTSFFSVYASTSTKLDYKGISGYVNYFGILPKRIPTQSIQRKNTKYRDKVLRVFFFFFALPDRN